jgi:FKBP-type peptidyl-prolyl cis-trans isomerase FkpA
MNKFTLPLLLGVLVLAAGCKKDGASGAAGDTLDAETSYAFGMLIAREFSLPGVSFDSKALLEGYRAMIEGNAKFSQEEALAKIEPVFVAAMESQTRGLLEAEERFLTEIRLKPGITVTGSGLQYEVITQGGGDMPGLDSTVRVHYRGTLIDGTVFDSSYDRGEPAVFPLQGVIPGWAEGLQLMNEGGSFRFYIPSYLGYGDRSDNLPPYSTLIFDVELLDILSQGTQE